ncbi:MAG TPA: hypothetical protein VIF62_37050 [Labilithrix sp.]
MRSLLLLSILSLAACASSGGDDVDATDQSPDAIVEAGVVVADPAATQVATVEDGRVRLSGPSADKYASLAPGSIFVGARGGAKNPDGFLRRVTRLSREGSELVVETTPATLTDAVVSGAMNASSGTKPLDETEGLHALSESAKSFGEIDIDFGNVTLFDNVDDVGGAKLHEQIVLDKAVLSARPFVNVDMQIAERKVTRFTALVEGNMDTSVHATAHVTLDGTPDADALKALAAKHNTISKVIYESPRAPLPTISIGRVPVSPAVKFTVTLTCDLAFGGTFDAQAGVEAKSYVRLGGVFEKEAWQDPIKSDFDIQPSFTINRAGPIDARCAIETQVELSAYGVGGVTMSVAPYVDFGVSPPASTRDNMLYPWQVDAGADGVMHGKNDVFGLPESDLERTLVQWKGKALTGHAR